MTPSVGQLVKLSFSHVTFGNYPFTDFTRVNDEKID